MRVSPSPAALRSLSERSADAALEADAEQLLRLHGELHRQLAEDLLAEAVDDHRDRVLRLQAALPAVEQLVLSDLGRRGLVLEPRRAVLHLDVRKGVRAAVAPHQERVALRVVARALRPLHD